jgi:hypothetical protein
MASVYGPPPPGLHCVWQEIGMEEGRGGVSVSAPVHLPAGLTWVGRFPTKSW